MGLEKRLEEMVTTSPSRHYSGHCRDMEEENVQGISGKENWTKKYRRQDTNTA